MVVVVQGKPRHSGWPANEDGGRGEGVPAGVWQQLPRPARREEQIRRKGDARKGTASAEHRSLPRRSWARSAGGGTNSIISREGRLEASSAAGRETTSVADGWSARIARCAVCRSSSITCGLHPDA
eukprot:scaffold62234_cov32-Tisochrysis_lutea.AAC.1